LILGTDFKSVPFFNMHSFIFNKKTTFYLAPN